MKIQNLSMQTNTFQNKKNEDYSLNKSYSKISLTRGFGYPKGFTPYFGARLNRTPENFYEQEFNKNGMPQTIKNYLYADYEARKTKPPMQLHKEAFSDLDQLCESVEDVKEMYPDEPLFQNLKTLETIRPTGGYLCALRMVGEKNNTVLASGEDLTVYLLKKVFVEGKDIDEINKDFSKDIRDDLKTQENFIKDGYLTYSTLKTLGIHLPDKSYWASLQANRADKEYIPHVITVKTPRRKPVFTKPRVRKPLNLSPEEKQRRRDVMIQRWIDMSPAQRQAQLDKMKEGQENSFYFQYMPQIMLIATDRAKFSDKMYHFFRENKESYGAEAPDDLNKLNPKQVKGVHAFWAQNNRVRKSFSYHMGAVIREFEAAQNDEEALNKLLKTAENIDIRNSIKAVRREYSNPEYVKKDLFNLVWQQAEYFPDAFKEKYVKFLMGHKRFNEELIPIRAQFLCSNSHNDKLLEKTQDIMRDLYNEFGDKNKRDVMAAEIAVSAVVRPFILQKSNEYRMMGQDGLANLALEDSFISSSKNVMGLVEMIDRYNLRDVVLQNSALVNKAMESYTKGMCDEDAKTVTKNLIYYMGAMIESGGSYRFLADPDIRIRFKKYGLKAYKAIVSNKMTRKYIREYMKDYEPRLRYAEHVISVYNNMPNPSETEKMLAKKHRYYVYETIIDDLLTNFEK